jgi:putative PEP-CTERM system histidine kinase
MSFLPFPSLTALLVAAAAATMTCLLLLRRQANTLHRALAAVLGATALANLANGIGSLDQAHALFWREIAMVGELAQPAALLYVGLAFMNPSERRGNSSMLWLARIATCAGCLLMIPTMTGHVFQLNELPDGQTTIGLVPWGGLISYMFVVIGMALGLAQIELVLSASQEPARYQLKFILIGLGGLGGYQIYQASQMLLFPVWQTGYVLVSALVTTIALTLISFGLVRTKLREVVVNAYISQQALLGSIAFIVTGLYLLVIGAAGEWLRRTGQPLWTELSIVFAFGSLIGLAILLFSRKAGSEIRRLVARNFYRSKYDYRARWLEVTKTFQQATTKDAIMDCLFDLLTRIFPTTTISLWSFREADRRFARIRPVSTKMDESVPIEDSHPIIMQMTDGEPVLIQKSLAVNHEALNESGDLLVYPTTALCLPIRAQGKLTAFVAFGKPGHGESYDIDDCDLLTGIAHYVGVLLSHASLSEERQAAAELEALHRFSVFCLHDLKNLAARLSLIAQNVGNHGKNPAFQDSAMRTVADTAKQITTLVSKLSLKSPQPVMARPQELIDISALVEEVVAPMTSAEGVPIQVHGGKVQPVLGIQEQIHQVLLNVVLNARQATGQDGHILISIEQLDDSVVVTVSDTGNGIPDDLLESLFRPSQSYRAGGLGIGLYQCKKIMEAHRGTIQVRSVEKRGTQVQLEFPLPGSSIDAPGKAMAHSTIP